MFKDVYVRPGNETTEQLHAAMVEKSTTVLQETTLQLPPETPIKDITIEHSRGRCIEGRSDNPKGSACLDEGANKGLGRGDKELCRDGEKPCMSHTDVWPPSLAISTSSCSTFHLRATSPCRYPVA
ncbi:hypothetical protein D8674_034188 [Pyrus ussuriensis x Pyrus communis]|uniref:Uncharacterized protein n=1 Tax=Pyrus ussuriensis x Pyrus communis TaxID=2448454 RepID=A0A5N5HRQ9_9ROSA|nr:hypothetical protein D8674_034188 [Pyrus ussuriensis x Pyrus communis]